MKDYSIFVNSAYLITFFIVIIFSCYTLWQFKKHSKKLAALKKIKNEKK